MGYPVKILVDNFEYLGEKIGKNEIFNAPTLWFESFLCDQEKTGARVKLGNKVPEFEKSFKLVSPAKRGRYSTRHLTPGKPDLPPVVAPEQTDALEQEEPAEVTESQETADESGENT